MAAFDEQEYTKSFDIKIWKRLLPFLRVYGWDFVGMLVFNGVCALVDVVLPLFQRYAIANFIEPDTLAGLWPYALTYLAVVILQCLSVVAFARNSLCGSKCCWAAICGTSCFTISRPCPSPFTT